MREKSNRRGVMRFFLLVSTFFSIVLLTMHMALLPIPETCPSGVSPEHEHVKAGEVVSAYYLSWHGKKMYTPEDFERIADKVTHVMYAFAQPTKEGNCELLHPKFAFGVGPNYEVPAGHFEQFQDIKRRHPHLKVLLSIGGGGSDHIFIYLYKNNLLKKYAKSCVEMLTKYSYTFKQKKDQDEKTMHFKYKKLFDGIDINWEFSPRGVKEGYAQAYLEFVKEMRRLLDKHERKLRRPLYLTATLQISPAVYRSLPLVEAAEHLDWFHVMAYDIFGLNSKTIADNSPICGSYGLYTIDGALNRIIDLGISPEKLVLGISGYGYQYDQTDGYGKLFNKKSKKSKSVRYRDIQKYFLTNDNYESKWSERGFVPYLHNKIDRRVICYDNPDSVRYKVQLAADKRLAGVMLWALSFDDEYHSLLHVLSDQVGVGMFV